MTNPAPKGGRPTSLDDLITVRAGDGSTRTVTAETRILELMAIGTHVDTAAVSLGIVRPTLHEWLKIGAIVRKTRLAGTRTTFSDHELRCEKFSDSVDTEIERWRLDAESILQRSHRPTKKTVTTTKTNRRGDVIETTTKVEEIPADLATLRWRVERHPATRHDYRPPNQAVEHSGPDGEAIPVEIDADSLLTKIRQTRTQETNDAEPE